LRKLKYGRTKEMEKVEEEIEHILRYKLHSQKDSLITITVTVTHTEETMKEVDMFLENLDSDIRGFLERVGKDAKEKHS